MNNIIKWGIIGCGKIAHKFAQDLSKVPNAKLYAIASRDFDKAKEFGKKYDVSNYYGNYQDLARDQEVIVIYIATPHPFHHTNTIMCLNHKKAVLCEKPFAMNIDQVKEMISTAKMNNVFLMEALWTYFLPHYQYVIELIETKKYGKIKSLKADFGFEAIFDPNSRLFNKKLGGGSLLDIGIYPLFCALSLIGIPEKIDAKAILTSTGVDEECMIQLEYKNNIHAHLYSTLNKKTDTEAIIELEDANIIICNRFHEPTSVIIESNQQSKKIEFDVDTYGYNFEAIHVQEMLMQNRIESTIMTFEKSLQLISLLDAVRAQIGLYYD